MKRTSPSDGDEPAPDSAPIPDRPARERSARYPGVPLDEALEFCRVLDDRGLDGLSGAAIAAALGFTNIKTNSFSARISAARQFGLLRPAEDGYALTPLARAILHPVDRAELPRLHRRALLEPPLYAELAARLAERKVPEPAILGNVLYHHHHITAAAKLIAAEAFLASARFAGALDDDGVFRPQGTAPPPLPTPPPEAPAEAIAPRRPPDPAPGAADPGADVRLDLRLWGTDRGKTIRLRAPEAITPASFERFLQAFRLHVRVEEPPAPAPEPEPEAADRAAPD
ncbi:MAG TPA: hypothetical protein VF590_14260 [Isosphaeraceae bacterium]|jgi:hypothetical protein